MAATEASAVTNYPKHRCVGCGSEETEVVGVHGDFGTTVFHCHQCQLGQSEYLSDQFLKGFYAKQYREVRRETIRPKYVDYMAARGAQQRRYIFDVARENNREVRAPVLEIGAGIGCLIETFVPFAPLYAAEYDQEFKKYLISKKTLRVIDDHRTLGVGFRAHFGLIALSHVFEHLNRPVEALEEISRLLRYDGLIFIEVPNTMLDSFRPMGARRVTRVKGSGHLFFFNDKSLRSVVARTSDLDVLDISYAGVPILGRFEKPKATGHFATSKDANLGSLRAILHKRGGIERPRLQRLVRRLAALVPSFVK
jgi:SAM-dependent methyltransferase